MAELAQVKQWLLSLSRLSATRMQSSEVADFVDQHAAFLADRFDSQAFCAASLEHVAAGCKFLPSYGEMVSLLRDWWQDYRPPAAITHDNGLSDQDRACVANWERHAAGNWGKQTPRKTDAAIRYELGLWQRAQPRVFAHLVASNERARFMATRAGLITLPRAAATSVPPEVRRGPPLDDDEPDA